MPVVGFRFHPIGLSTLPEGSDWEYLQFVVGRISERIRLSDTSADIRFVASCLKAS